MTGGYFSVPHEIAERLLALEDGAWSFGAYCWLCKKAAWARRVEIVCRRQVEIERGQLCVAQRYLARAWNCSLGRVQRFLALIREWNEVEYACESGQMLITVCRYSEKQAPAEARESPTGTGSGTRSGTKEEELKKESSSVSKEPEVCVARAREPIADEVQIDREFDALWSIWPRKQREACSRAAYRRKRRIVDKEELAAGIRRLAARHAHTERRYVPLLLTAIEKGLWREEQAEILLPLETSGDRDARASERSPPIAAGSRKIGFGPDPELVRAKRRAGLLAALDRRMAAGGAPPGAG